MHYIKNICFSGQRRIFPGFKVEKKYDVNIKGNAVLQITVPSPGRLLQVLHPYLLKGIRFSKDSHFGALVASHIYKKEKAAYFYVTYINDLNLHL